ncbi:YheV family putative zinc ribbon protein [Microbulbifer discodermiae]|uniref:YheV family putative zinc ribbon protein n=1 Tax=Microbulbifer sp. 2201CG32-9 TaxID=3232309 RepID=UPI00345BF85D
MQSGSKPSPKAEKRRFIAGAVCPKCGEMDRIVNYNRGQRNYRECVACGFKDEIRLQSSPRELSTRVSEQAQSEDAERPVRFIQPPKKP